MALRERWRDVPGYEGIYQVSDQGNVRSLRFKNGVVDKLRDEPYWMKPHWIKGYAHVTLWDSKGPHLCRISVLVLLAFVGPRPEGKQAAHIDGVKAHNQLSNLTWKTPVENQADRKLHGTNCAGEKHWKAKLTDEKVRAIREEFKHRTSYRYGLDEMAARYGVSKITIGRVRRGDGWSHL